MSVPDLIPRSDLRTWTVGRLRYEERDGEVVVYEEKKDPEGRLHWHILHHFDPHPGKAILNLLEELDELRARAEGAEEEMREQKEHEERP